MSECKENCKVKIDMEVVKRDMQHHVDSLKEATNSIADCVEDIHRAVELLTNGRVELARQDERLKAGNKKFKEHATFITLALGLSISEALFIAATHGPAFLKYLKVIL